jgi:hypothetical protein
MFADQQSDYGSGTLTTNPEHRALAQGASLADFGSVKARWPRETNGGVQGGYR